MSGNEFEEGPIFVVLEGKGEEGEPPPEDRTPWTITIEVTLDVRSHQEAEAEGEKMLDYIVSGWDGAAGAVMGVEPNA